MTAIDNMVSLHDGRPGLRALMQVEAREADVADLGSSASGSVLDFIASTATLDRYHEVIEPAGWRLDSYRRNPVFQNAHNYGDVLFTLGKALVTEVRAVGERQALCQRIQFATEVNPVARIAYGLYKGGFLNAVSVGFIPLRWEDPPRQSGGVSQGRGVSSQYLHQTTVQIHDALTPAAAAQIHDGLTPAAAGATGPRRRYLEQELLEVSAVAIPANPDALALGLKSGAVGRSDIEETMEIFRSLVLDQDGRGDEWMNLAREFRRVMQKA